MKRLLLLSVCAALFVSPSIGQITIQLSDFTAMFSPGNPIRFNADTLSLQNGSINVGHKGGPQTFDFSGLTFFEFGTDTIRLVAADPFLAARFDPTAVQFKIGQSQPEYDQPILFLGNNSMTQIGQLRYYGTDSLQIRHSSPGEPFLNFPITLGDSIQVTSSGTDTTLVSGVFARASSASRTKTVVVDAFGTLLLPGGKSYECLRVRDTESLPNNGKEFRFVTQTGGMLFVSSYNTEADTGNVLMQDPIQYIFNPIITNVGRNVILPTTTALGQNYPNPFNPETTISFELSTISNVKLTVYDLLGRAVATLVDGMLPSGPHKAAWNASRFPSGLYFYKLEAGGFVESRKMVLMK